ncbi:hypothetical protein BH11VER1_BH11VER1_22140 [soil metagenome]
MLMLLALLLTVAGCKQDPVDESLTLTEPDELDLVGTYEIDKLRLPVELADLKLDTRLELMGDGRFNARNIPPSSSGDHAPAANFSHTLTSATGIWNKRKSSILKPAQAPVWGIHLADRPYTAANVNGPRNEWLSVRCTGQAPPFGILFQLGDPDHGYSIHLKRSTPEAISAPELKPTKQRKPQILLPES